MFRDDNTKKQEEAVHAVVGLSAKDKIKSEYLMAVVKEFYKNVILINAGAWRMEPSVADLFDRQPTSFGFVILGGGILIFGRR